MAFAALGKSTVSLPALLARKSSLPQYSGLPAFFAHESQSLTAAAPFISTRRHANGAVQPYYLAVKVPVAANLEYE